MTTHIISRVQPLHVPSQRHTITSAMYLATILEPTLTLILWEVQSVDYVIELTLDAMSSYQNKVGPEGASL